MSDQRRSGFPQSGIARHGRLKRPNPVLGVLRFLAVSVVVVAVSAASVVALDGYRAIQATDIVVLPGESDGPPPDIAAMEGGFNILIVGSDTGIGQGALGHDRGSAELNDVTMILHVSQDHSNAVAVSIPRDLVVPFPPCPRKSGSGVTPRMTGQPINVALSYGGLACAVVVVEALTGLKMNFAGLITFQGVIQMATAVGGVPVCLSEPIKDRYTGFNMPAGTHLLEGAQALKFLRSRHAVGDGSDLTRISSQQVYLSSLVRTLKSSDTLHDIPKLYNIANAALSNMQLSSGFAHPDVLVAIARALSDLELDRVTFVQYPGTTGGTGIYKGKVKPITSVANALFAKIRADEPFALPKASDGRATIIDPNATPLPSDSLDPTATPTATAEPVGNLPVIPGLIGQTAATQTCTKANHG